MSLHQTSFGDVYVPYFEEQIEIQREAIVSFKRWMVGFVILGLVIISSVILFNNKLGSTGSQITSIGGVFIGALSAFPYREIAPRRSRIASYNLLKKGFEKIKDLPSDDQQKLKELAHETLKKNL